MINGPVAYDFGTRYIKAASRDAEFRSLHARRRATEADMSNDVFVDEPSIYEVNGELWQFGQKAEGGEQARRGATKYTDPEYYRSFLGYTLFQLSPDKNDRSIKLFAGHAPHDSAYTDDIEDAVVGHDIVVTHNDVTRKYRCVKVGFWPEPVGALMHEILDNDGNFVAGSQLKSGNTLIIDVGSLTIDYAVAINQKIQENQIGSYRETPLIDAEERIFFRVQKRWKKELETLGHHNIANNIRLAMRSGILDAGGYGNIDISDIVREETQPIIAFVQNMYLRLGGTGRFHNVLLTGGGSGILIDRITEALDRPESSPPIISGDIEYVQYANVFGAWKLANYYSLKGVL